MGKVIPDKPGVMAKAPDFMLSVPEDQQGLELVRQYVIPPRVKTVQPTARKPFSELFKAGDVVAVPDMQLIAKFTDGKTPAFTFVPVFYWVEWCLWNPLEARGTLPAIKARTLDPRSEIAAKARNADRRNAEPCPEYPDKKMKYVEHLNYMIWPLDGLYAERPIMLSFSRGEWMTGSRFNSLVMGRKAPLFGCRFEAVVRERENAKGRWYGVDVDNPFDGNAFVQDQALFEGLKKANEQFKTDHAERRLQADYGDDDEVTPEAPRDSKDF